MAEQLVGQHRGLRAPLEAQLGKQARDVVLHRLLGEEHLRPDLPVRQALRHELEDAALLRRQGPELLRLAVGAGADPLQHPLRHGRVEQAAARGDGPDGVHEVGAADLLEAVSRPPRHDRVEQGLVILVRGQHQRLDRRVLRTDVPADVDAVAVRQPGVEDGDVGAQRRDDPGGLPRRPGLPDDPDVVGGLEQGGQAAPDHLVVVEQEDADHPTSLNGAIGAAEGRRSRPRIARTGGAMDQDEPTLRSLRLDDLLRELVARAEDVLEVEDRLQRLLDAVVSVASDLSLPDTLRRIVELAVDLADARYGALGVIGPDGRLSQFVTAGVDDELRRRIGDLPTGHGILRVLIRDPRPLRVGTPRPGPRILGVLIRDPRPLRIANLAEHGGRAGFPANRPPMTTFLGVPVRSRGEVFGNLYLTEKRGGGEFTERDEDVVVALAAAAGVAIENSRLFEEVRRREAWLSAASEVTSRLLAGGDAAVTARLVVAKAAELTSAQGALLLLPDADGLVVRAVHGADDVIGIERVGRGYSWDDDLAAARPADLADLLAGRLGALTPDIAGASALDGSRPAV